MKKRISLKLFLTVLWRGICQAFGFIPKLLGYKDESTYVRAIWKILITCVAIVATIITCGFLYCFGVDIVYDKWIKPYIQESNIYWTQYLSNHIVFQEMSTGTGRIYDTTRDKVLLKRVCWVLVSDDKDSLAVYSKDDKRGYINRFTGEVVIPAETFTKAWTFSEGLAAVEKEKKLLFIDHSGNVVIDKDLEAHFSNPPYVFKNGYCLAHNTVTGKVGIIDKKGDWVLNPEYTEIVNIDGFWKVEKDGLHGLYDKNLKEMFPTTNTAIWFDENNIIEVRANDNTAQRYDYAGNLLVDFVIDQIDYIYYEKESSQARMSEIDSYDEYFNDEIAYETATCLQYRVNAGYSYPDHYGLMSREGKRITPPIYTKIEAISKDLYLCYPDGVVINGQGKIIK